MLGGIVPKNFLLKTILLISAPRTCLTFPSSDSSPMSNASLTASGGACSVSISQLDDRLSAWYSQFRILDWLL